MSPFARGAVALVVALLVVLGVTALALRGADGPVAEATPSPTPILSPTPDPATTPGPAPDDALAILAEIEAQVVAIRELPPADIGPAEILTREELAAELRALFEEDYPPEEREADNATLRAMGLLEADQDIGELQLRLLEQQVLGFYDDDEQRMVVVTDRGLDGEAKITYAHEYTHALQDAAFGLASLGLDESGDDDRVMAAVALVEGDATVTMLLWAFEHLSPAEMQDLGTAPVPDTAGAPDWLVQALLWPYEAGPTFVIQLLGNMAEPDWAALDEAFANPPVSTAQILEPDKYLSGVEPVPVDPVDLASEMESVAGGSWSEADSTPIGEAFTGIWLDALGVATPIAQAAARGWAGDRLTVATAGDDEWVLHWHFVWETAADADEFVEAYESVSGDLPFSAELVRMGETELLVRHAASSELLAAIP
jgi:hypothetical protein